MNTHPYSSDFSDNERLMLAPLIKAGKRSGRPQLLEMRRDVDAVFYHFAQRRRRRTWEQINASLGGQHRVAKGRNAQPTAAIIDSQSARTTEAGRPRGYDGGKKVSSRKRHVLVDTEGNLLKARVHPADIHDRRGAGLLLKGLRAEFPRIALIWADSASQGLKAWLAETLGWQLAISKHWWTGLHGVWVAPGQQPPEIPRGFHALKRRRVVERTLAWVGRNRRMSRDYERLVETAELLVHASTARVTLRRLASRMRDNCLTASKW